ncbi:GspE/PulE family protein [Granulosicoccus sp. 3-233]|uniref:GspE/PulE family protein n=1 Tax=Granulosicoccus sp. 3-233 TaxID=3417969 RepID=UPI003D32DD4C
MKPDSQIFVQSLQQLIPSPEATACLTEAAARRLQLVPLARNRVEQRDSLLVACADPSDQAVLERLERQVPVGINPVLIAADAAEIPGAIDKCYSSTATLDELLELCRQPATAMQLLQNQPDAIVRLLEYLLLAARRQRASDMHLSPEGRHLHVRFRVDGVLRHFSTLSKSVHNGLLVRIKILSSVDIAETRRPQDGQFSQFMDGSVIDFRVSCFPTVNGQNTVIRLLDSHCRYDSLQRLNLPQDLYQALAGLAHRPEGLLVICGPTGSGKSNTLHALINERDAESLNIMTLEDPVEIAMAGIRQSSIDAEHAMDFAQGVRGLLRQDPDVLLIGEVRDIPSCAMALRAVMSGHQLLTTVHASSAMAGLARLKELGALAGQLAENLMAIASQRLVRRFCQECEGRRDRCQACQGSGYQGRQLIMELLLITPPLAALIAKDEPAQVLLECARTQGFRTLREQGEGLVRQGLTSRKEIERVLGREDRPGSRSTGQGELSNAIEHS